MATIEIIIGSMFSGKTTELMRRCRTYSAIGHQVLIVNNNNDTRCSNKIQSHNKESIDAIKIDKLMNLDISENINVIAIDEAQFFDDLYEFVQAFESKTFHIIIAGLDGDFKRQTFGHILKCIPLCDTVTKLNAMCSVCKNGNLASFSRRITNNSDIVCIGADEKYIPVCRKHFILSNDVHSSNM